MSGLAALALACAIKVTAVLVGAAAFCGMARRASAALRHRVWALAIGCGLALPLLQFAIALLPEAPAGGSAATWPTVPFLPAADSFGGSVFSLTVHAMPGPFWTMAWTRWAPWLWLAGAAFSALRLGAGGLGLWRMSRRSRACRDARMVGAMQRCARHLGIRRQVRLRVLEGSTMPCTWGWRRPVVLLPAGCAKWPEGRRNVVLRHELAHIQRLDWPMGILAEVARAVYWFHPLAWAAVRNLRRESEHACDDAVLAAGEDAARYAGELLHLVRGADRSSRLLSTALAVAQSYNLTRRITAMLDPTINRRRLTRRATLVSTALTLLLLLPMAALRAPAQNAGGNFSGRIVDPSGAGVSAATVMVSNAATHAREMTATDATGSFRFAGLAAGEYETRVLKPGFAEAVRPMVLERDEDLVQKITLAPGTINETVRVSPSAAPTGPQTMAAPKRIPVSSPVQAAALSLRVLPTYPQTAKAAGIEGTVELEAVIDRDGVPQSLQVTNATADPDLARAAVEAVSQWRYRPTLLNGEPVEVATKIEVNFTLQR